VVKVFLFFLYLNLIFLLESNFFITFEKQNKTPMINQIYHNYSFWEDWKYGFYDQISGLKKDEKLNSCINYFNDINLVKQFMSKVINEWKYSCEVNFSNPSINKIAYLGQASCSLYDKIPCLVTMEAWNMLKPEVQAYSNEIAQENINQWFLNYKSNQLCIEFI
jgi:hypothetical protein